MALRVMSAGMAGTSCVIISFSASKLCGQSWYTPQGRKSHGINFGERGGQPMLPRTEMTCPGNIIETLDVCAVAPFCRNHKFPT